MWLEGLKPMAPDYWGPQKSYRIFLATVIIAVNRGFLQVKELNNSDQLMKNSEQEVNEEQRTRGMVEKNSRLSYSKLPS